MAASFHVQNFGCRAARADGEAIARLLRTPDGSERSDACRDVIIVNTCSVTEEADREARAYIRRAHRQNPEAQIIATGCYAQRAPHELRALPGVAAVIGNSHKAFVPEIARLLGASGKAGSCSSRLVQIEGQRPLPGMILADDAFAHSFLEEGTLAAGTQTRPNLKIQDGCTNRCSFCVIPKTRGNSRSLPAPVVLDHVRGFVAGGGKELVLSGINLGRWGRDLEVSSHPVRNLSALVRTILLETDLARLRLSSIEPMDWDPELIGLLADLCGRSGSRRLARHVHLPLQSGSDAVLRRMFRRYRPWHYAEKVEQLFAAVGPGLTLGADVMVGFPGETETEFRETFDFIHALPFAYLHLFPFSARPGTRAWTLQTESPVAGSAVSERMAALRELAGKKARAHRSQFINAELEAISLRAPKSAPERGVALSENFLPVDLTAPLPANRLVRIRIAAVAPDNRLIGSIAV